MTAQDGATEESPLLRARSYGDEAPLEPDQHDSAAGTPVNAGRAASIMIALGLLIFIQSAFSF